MSIPVLRSLLSPHALRPLLETAYDIEIGRLQLIKPVIADTYRVVTAAGQYILRIYPGRRHTLTEIEAELDLVQFLHQQDIPVAVPIETRARARTLPLPTPEGERYAVLFTYAEGQPMGDEPAHARRFGATLARLHEAADKAPRDLARAPLDWRFLLERPLAHLNALGQRPRDWAYLQQLAAIIRHRVDNLPDAPPIGGYCHGDVGRANAHVSAHGEVTFFDFDFCGRGWRAYDVATLVSGEPESLIRAILAGYQSVRTLSDEELRALPLFQIAQKIWLLGTRADYIDEWGEIRFSRRFVDNVLGEIKLLAQEAGLT